MRVRDSEARRKMKYKEKWNYWLSAAIYFLFAVIWVVDRFKGDYYHKEWLHWECYQKLEREGNEDRIDNWMKAWDEAVIRGGFDNQSFYQAFAEFDNQSIEASLASGNLLVRIFAVLDRRLGKRRLERLSKAWGSEPEYLKFFLHLRMEAEGVRML